MPGVRRSRSRRARSGPSACRRQSTPCPKCGSLERTYSVVSLKTPMEIHESPQWEGRKREKCDVCQFLTNRRWICPFLPWQCRDMKESWKGSCLVVSIGLLALFATAGCTIEPSQNPEHYQEDFGGAPTPFVIYSQASDGQIAVHLERGRCRSVATGARAPTSRGEPVHLSLSDRECPRPLRVRKSRNVVSPYGSRRRRCLADSGSTGIEPWPPCGWLLFSSAINLSGRPHWHRFGWRPMVESRPRSARRCQHLRRPRHRYRPLRRGPLGWTTIRS